MPRELSPALFGRPQKPEAMEESHEPMMPTSPANEMPMSPPVHPPQQMDSVEAQVFSAQLEGLKERIHKMTQKIEALELKSRSDEGQSMHKTERVQSSIKHMESIIRTHVGDVNGKFAQVASRLNQQKVNEAKIEQMLDRHAQVVQTFETKLLGLQKVISEQELLLMNYKSELEAARRRK
ncbi:MAG: hypothetical protein CL677_04985 [Bdellovibrionaceae bacterium]|nr:hypothetical protein [Pseudobdellovibrionaceae bacterium]|tara:strand:+ start:1164 stop:1703 length:540 start_codon:yes stop_codon:yes gene_type:complete